MKNSQELKPCPFCGGEAKITVCDDEGNTHYEEDYEKRPWSGLGYMLSHDDIDNPNCPIAHEEYDSLGTYIYDSREEATEAWNRRADNG